MIFNTMIAAATGAAAQTRPQTFEGVVTLRSAERPKASLQGVIVSDETGEPLPGATVTVSRAYSSVIAMLSDETPGSSPESVNTSESGRFSFPTLESGDYLVRVSRPGYLSNVIDRTTARGLVTLSPGARNDNLVIRLSRSAVIQGVIRDEGGMPVAGAPVRLLQPNSTAAIAVYGKTGDDGRYQLEGFPRGNYVLVAGVPVATGEPAQSSASTISWIAPETKTLDLTLMRTATLTISGKIRDAGTNLPPKQPMWLVSVSATWGNSFLSVDARVQYDERSGQFETEKLYPGIYRLAVRSSDNFGPTCANSELAIFDESVRVPELILNQCTR